MDVLQNAYGDIFWLLPIPGDGNCLFGSVIHQLCCASPNHQHFGAYRSQLRDAAVSELRNRIDFYVDYLAVSAEEAFEDPSPVANKIERFLVALESDGFWGGEESLAAICNLHQVAITVHQINGTIEFTPTVSENQSWRVLDIFYRNLPGFVEKTHYDSVVAVRRLRQETCFNPHAHSTEVFLRSEAIFVYAVEFTDHQESLFISVYHQLTNTHPTSDTISLFRGLVADDLEARSVTFLRSFGILIETPTELSEFIFRLRIGRVDGGLASLVVLSSLLRVVIYLHSHDREPCRIKPSGTQGILSIHVLEQDQGEFVSYASITSLLDQTLRSARVTSESAVVPADVMDIAVAVAREEQASQETVHPSIELNPRHGLRFASLNVNGCRVGRKRMSIDQCLLSHRVHLAVLQEVNLDCERLITSNYQWLMGPRAMNRKRGLAILYRHGLDVQVQKSFERGPYIQCLELSYQVVTTFSFILGLPYQ